MKSQATFDSRVLATFVATAVVVVALTFMTWKVSSTANSASKMVLHTQEVLNYLGLIRVQTIQTELSTQSYRISGNPERLTERNRAIATREQLLEKVKNLIADNPQQQKLWDQLREVIDERIAISRRVEELRATQGATAANAYVATAPLDATRARTATILQDMEREEQHLLNTRQAQESGARAQMLILGSGASILVILLLAGSYFLIRRQMEEVRASRQKLAESEESLSITLHSIGDAVIATDTAGRVTRMNSVAERLTGWTLTEALGQNIADVFHIVNEQTRGAAEIPVARVLATGEVQELANHTVLIARNGLGTPIADSAAPIRDDSGAIQGVVIVFRDETVVRQAKKNIRDQNDLLEQRVQERTAQWMESNSHLNSIINHIPALIAYVDSGQRYVYANDLYIQRFSSQGQGITGCTVEEILGPDRYRIAAPLIAKVLQGEPQSYDWEPFPGVWQSISYVARRDAQGQIAGYYVLGTDITTRRRTEDALRKSQQQLARVLEGSDQGYWDWNLATNEFQVSARWETMLGYEPGEMQVDTDHWPDMVHPTDLRAANASIEKHLSGATPSHEVEIRCLTKGGDWKWIFTRGSVVERAADGSPLKMAGTHTDISERKRLELAQAEALVVFNSSYEGIMVANAQGLISKVNPAFTRITGYAEAEVQGVSPRLLASGRHDPQFFQEFWASLNTRDFWRGEIWNRRKNGDTFASLQSITVVRDAVGAVSHYVSVFTDISQLKAHEAELDRAANYDPLTELPNRRLLSDRLARSIFRAQRSGKSCAICLLDLDGFKAINDQRGHEVGDLVLVGVAGHLRTVMRSDDTLARLGGDEFVLLLSEVSSTEECTLILERVLQAIRRPVFANGQMLHVSASIGVSLYPDDNADPDTLLRHADHAMYLAKQAGRDRYQLFDLESDRLAQTHRAYVEQMRSGLQHHEFVLYYQPKVDLVDGTLVGVEALIRWQHPTRGLLPPGEFLPHLQGSNLEQLFGEWVIETALNQIESWSAQELSIPVSVNISANHLLQPEFSDNLRLALARHPLSMRSALELEVLETAAIQDMQLAVEVLQSCARSGVKFALDDFGTGYSSLTYLRKLPVHTLKIDQSFVRDMLTDADDLGIVKSVIDLAAAFQRQVIAEGVETLAHGKALRDMGCRFAQGYGIAKPMPAEHIPSWQNQWLQTAPWRTL